MQDYLVTERQKLILIAIVEEYVKTNEPVGSLALSRREELNFSSATLRNDMAMLEEKAVKVAIEAYKNRKAGKLYNGRIEIKDGLACTEEEIDDFCKALPRYKRPRKVIFDKVPRNPTGKIEKPKLREIYGAKQLVAEQVER